MILLKIKLMLLSSYAAALFLIAFCFVLYVFGIEGTLFNFILAIIGAAATWYGTYRLIDFTRDK